MREHWSNCITNFDDDVASFIRDYFADPSRRVLLVAAAGFDPRSQRVSQLLADTLDERLSAYYIREERPGATDELVKRADANETALKAIVPASKVFVLPVFADDGAPVGGARLVSEILANPIPADVTDVILDLSALSIGIGFPAAKLLLEECEEDGNRAFHLMIVSNPELDDQISSVPSSRISPVKGFAPDVGMSALEVAPVWIPQLARGRASTLTQIGASSGNWYKICPVLPFPARNPRRADDLLTEFQTELVDEWEIDPRDIVYASEKNPLDCYRTLSTLKQRIDRTMEGTYDPRMVLSPLGSKVLAAGAMMAAIEHGMSVQYVETESYDFSAAKPSPSDPPDMMVHLVLSGPLYAGYSEE
ncbi:MULTISPECIES: hypothetical protein [Sphingobium]|uniref:Uncharacterized protein n=1 Tax=Sphingobium fuliginis (strain ATCC 27551) TaxID=336203 RepID=A0A292ZP36_SPHSA|nr:MULTISPECIES: hypothetical protein [Sphingobium]OAP29959.1 hypothetical protein A8O16_20800 [Sphingobium sp. 20006FA]KXU29820.1 hypothetical protein AXW74_20830 [Sphingobium sp. AM]KYC30368.1 hypothetical protein A0J57_20825 [Sphingobium sp. 22B]MCB4859029.1 hypothetical protein [Sphingobium sp. PNB]MEC6701376.1 hypothetical protein [Sphingobium sp. SJ10-10]